MGLRGPEHFVFAQLLNMAAYVGKKFNSFSDANRVTLSLLVEVKYLEFSNSGTLNGRRVAEVSLSDASHCQISSKSVKWL